MFFEEPEPELTPFNLREQFVKDLDKALERDSWARWDKERTGGTPK